MAEVNRRSFLRLLRRSEEKGVEEGAEDAPPAPLDPEAQQLADLTASLLADVASEDEEQLAEAVAYTRAFDRCYMRVTSGHIVFSAVTGFSTIIQTGDVVALDTEPPVEVKGSGNHIYAVLRAHHPADLPTVTRSYSFRFPQEGGLLEAIRTVCDLPEPEPEPAEADAAQAPESGPS